MTLESQNPSADLFGARRTVEQVEEGNELAPKFVTCPHCEREFDARKA